MAPVALFSFPSASASSVRRRGCAGGEICGPRSRHFVAPCSALCEAMAVSRPGVGGGGGLGLSGPGEGLFRDESIHRPELTAE